MDLDQYLEKMITNTAFIWIRGVEEPKNGYFYGFGAKNSIKSPILG